MNAQETVDYLLQLPKETEYFSNDGTILKVIPKTAEYPKLSAMQKFVGGRIERVSLSNGDDLIIYEEGLYDDSPANQVATRLFYDDVGKEVVQDNQLPPLFGNIIYLQGGLK